MGQITSATEFQMVSRMAIQRIPTGIYRDYYELKKTIFARMLENKKKVKISPVLVTMVQEAMIGISLFGGVTHRALGINRYGW